MYQVNAPNPGLDSNGDYDAAQDLWDEANAAHWTPEVWHLGPRILIERERSWIHHNMIGVSVAATKHDNPPAHTALRDF